ncbi:MAG: hypothetical protein HFJ55_03130 [Clostridia bacterium]|nr:hypothetical protein [Clostridia bacterium]
MVLEQEYTVKLSEIGKRNKVTNKSILGYLEDIGGIHSNMAKLGVHDRDANNLGWILLEWKLEVIKRPNCHEKVKVKTWSKPARRCYAYRDFEIYDMDGNIIAKAISKWVLMDIAKRKILKIEGEISERYEPELNKTVFDNEEFEKIEEPESFEIETEYKVKRADIDVNNHMHNLNYIDVAIEALPEEIYKNQLFDNIRISYKKEIKLGEIIKSQYAKVNDKHIITIKSKDGEKLHSIIELY